MSYIIGLDNGGTFTKAVLYDYNGNEIAKSKSQINVYNPKPLYVERSCDEVYEKNCEVIRNVILASSIDPMKIKAISISGHGKGLYLIGEDNNYVYNSILSTDNRAYEFTDMWEEKGVNRKLKTTIYQDLIPCQIPALLNWMKKYKPEVINATKWIFGIKDFIRYMLTGVANAEITDFSGSGIVDLNSKQYSDYLFSELNLLDLKDKFPVLIKSDQISGTITEDASKRTLLPVGTPVIAGLFDIDACALAMDIRNEDYLSVIGGTWSINQFISKEPNINGSKNSIYCIDDYYLVEESSPTSASNNEWMIQNLFDKDIKYCKDNNIDIYEYINNLVEKSDFNENGCLFYPFIYGSNYNQFAKSTIIGIDNMTKKQDIIRAVYEGIGFSHKVHIDRLKEIKTNFKAVRLAGGIAKSEIWVQILANIFNMPIQVIDQNELGTFGAMVLALKALGIYDSYEEISWKLITIKKTYYPEKPIATKYLDKYKKYRYVENIINKSWEVFR